MSKAVSWVAMPNSIVKEGMWKFQGIRREKVSIFVLDCKSQGNPPGEAYATGWMLCHTHTHLQGLNAMGKQMLNPPLATVRQEGGQTSISSEWQCRVIEQPWLVRTHETPVQKGGTLGLPYDLKNIVSVVSKLEHKIYGVPDAFLELIKLRALYLLSHSGKEGWMAGICSVLNKGCSLKFNQVNFGKLARNKFSKIRIKTGIL